MSTSRLGCYLCGDVADGTDDHVPPEVFFRGKMRSYKSPAILTVPSCRAHNEGTSTDDEMLAWVVCDASLLGGSHVAFDVVQALYEPIRTRVYSDIGFVNERLARIGVRLRRNACDYDENGLTKLPIRDVKYLKQAQEMLRARRTVLKRGLQKIAAGIFFHASGGERLGATATEALEVVVPSFKYINETSIFNEAPMSECDFFTSKIAWRPVESGSAEVFTCEISHQRRTKQFEMKLQFYEHTEVWIKTRKSKRV
jgi:hypothetical protein